MNSRLLVTNITFHFGLRQKINLFEMWVWCFYFGPCVLQIEPLHLKVEHAGMFVAKVMPEHCVKWTAIVKRMVTEASGELLWDYE